MNLREWLADISHQIWSHWMVYMFKCGTFNPDGSWTMPKEKVQRWERQAHTAYADLTSDEQESDRHQADKILNALARYMDPNQLYTQAVLEAYQRHHDYYVGLYKAGKLKRQDRAQYQLAMAREAFGLVKE